MTFRVQKLRPRLSFQNLQTAGIVRTDNLLDQTFEKKSDSSGRQSNFQSNSDALLWGYSPNLSQKTRNVFKNKYGLFNGDSSNAHQQLMAYMQKPQLTLIESLDLLEQLMTLQTGSQNDQGAPPAFSPEVEKIFERGFTQDVLIQNAFSNYIQGKGEEGICEADQQQSQLFDQTSQLFDLWTLNHVRLVQIAN